MAILNAVPITYINETERYNFGVAVFCHDGGGTHHQLPVVWAMLRTQTTAHFTYPAEIGVGAEWILDGVDNQDGPFLTKFGSTWNLMQTEKDGTPQLLKALSDPKRFEDIDGKGVIVVNNVPPDSWSGREYDFCLYKDGRKLLVQPQVGVSGSASLSITTELNFGIVPSTCSLAVGDVIESNAIEYVTPVDLTDYSSGLTITLKYNSDNGMYTFTPFSTPVFKKNHPHF